MRVGNLEWSDDLLDNDSYKTQADWLRWCADKKLNPKGWRLPSLNEYNDLLKNLHKESEFAEKLKKDFKEDWLMTSDVFVDINGVAWPVARGGFGNGYSVYGYDYYVIRASRGVRSLQKNKKVKKLS